VFSTSVKMCVGVLWWNSFESIASDVELPSNVIAAILSTIQTACVTVKWSVMMTGGVIACRRVSTSVK